MVSTILIVFSVDYFYRVSFRIRASTSPTEPTRLIEGDGFVLMVVTWG